MTSAMFDFSGDDLLNVFQDLNVQLLNLNPNVVKGWFDTDDPNMKNLLKWMCSSLSTDVFVSPLENAEYNDIECPISDEKLEQEISIIDTRYPELLDVDNIELDIDILQDEIDMLMKEEENLDNLISMNEELQRNLTQEWNDKLAMEIKTEANLKSSQEKCEELSQDLDERNAKLHKQLLRYGNNVYNFEFSEQPLFINNLDIDLYQEKYESLMSILKPFLDDPLLSFSCSMATNNTQLSINLNETIENTLSNLRNSISLSHQLYINSTVEVEKLKEILQFFSKNSIESIASLTESAFMQNTLETKEETKSRMFTMVENVTNKIADQHIALTKLKYTQHELDMYQSKLDILSVIEELIMRLLSQYLILSTLYIQEKDEIANSENYFRRVLQYINQDLHTCSSRTARMKEIINEYKSVEPKEKFKLINSMLRVIGLNDDLSLSKSLEALFEFKNELNRLESKVFSCSTNHKALGSDLKHNINALQSFLISGPTHRIVSVPYQLLSVIRETETILQKQDESIRDALEITTSVKKKNMKKWDIYKRQLWIYFYTEPQKLKFVLQQIEEEFLKLKVDNVNS